MKSESKVIFRKGKKVILRPIREEDIPTLLVWVNNPEVTKYLSVCDPISEAKEREWFEGLSKRTNDRIFGIETLQNEFIGVMGLHHICWKDGTATTGAFIGEEKCWGKGFGTDAKMLVLDYAFNSLNLRKICSSVLSFNERSYHYQKKCGCVEEGRQRAQVFSGGEYHDLIHLAVFRENWLPLWKEYKNS